jgi:The ARF-like 2 binding protein BART
MSDDEDSILFEDGDASQVDQMLETLLEAVNSDSFHEVLQSFASLHCDKFDDCDVHAGAEHKHDHFLLFQQYKEDIEGALKVAMNEAGVEFDPVSFAQSMKGRKDCPIFEQVADILNSINDFKAFKSEMVAFKAATRRLAI